MTHLLNVIEFTGIFPTEISLLLSAHLKDGSLGKLHIVLLSLSTG